MKSVRDVNIRGQRVLWRADLDLPLNNSVFAEKYLQKYILPTWNYLQQLQTKVVLLGGDTDPSNFRSSAELLARVTNRKFVVVPADSGRLPEYEIPHLYFFEHELSDPTLPTLVRKLKIGEVAILNSLAGNLGEQENDLDFAKGLSALGDVYIQDAFSDLPMKHASMTSVPTILPTVAGFALEKEFQKLSALIRHLRHPAVLLVGGIDLAGKIPAINLLARQFDSLLLGGGLANLVLQAKGMEIGQSVSGTRTDLDQAKTLWRDYRDKIILPLDLVVSYGNHHEVGVVKVEQVKPSQEILDIGPDTIRNFANILKNAETVVWVGSVGKSENSSSSHGTRSLALLVGSRNPARPQALVGGGSVLTVFSQLGLLQNLELWSVSGSAMLAVLAGLELPGLTALEA